MAEKLHWKDKKILSVLDLNARASYSEIGKTTRISRKVVEYRIKRLEEKGIIKGYYALTDFTRLGKLYIRCWIKYQDVSVDFESRFFEFLITHKHIGFIVSVRGRYDLAFTSTMDSFYEFQTVLDEIMAGFGAHIFDLDFSICNQIHFFGHGLFGTKGMLKVGEFEKVILDDLDNGILALLAKDGRMHVTRIAQKLNEHTSTINHRLRQLVKQGIIAGFMPVLDYHKFGVQFYKIFFQTQGLRESDYKAVIEFGRQDPRIVNVVRAISPIQIEIEVVVKEYNEFFSVLKDIYAQFGRLIKTHFYNQVETEHKVKYFGHIS